MSNLYPIIIVLNVGNTKDVQMYTELFFVYLAIQELFPHAISSKTTEKGTVVIIGPQLRIT